MEASAPLSEPPKWVVWSTRDSIDNDVPSVMAIVETLLAVPLYWWIAIHFATYAPLMVSAAVAPLVLLRSDESVALGVRWFRASWASQTFGHKVGYRELSSRERFVVWTSTGLIPVVCLIATYGVAWHWFSGTEVWSAFWRTAAITFGGPVAVAVAVAVRAIAGGVIGVVAVVVMAMVAGGAIAETLFTFPLSFALAVAVFVGSLHIRIAATLRHVGNGVRALPRNFRRLVLCTSPIQVPELIPGIEPGETLYTLSDLLRAIRSSRSQRALPYAVYPMLMLTWFLPGWSYRLTLKSTAWFWWPLAFLGDELRQAKDPVLFHRQTMRSLWGGTSIVLSLMTIAIFFAANFVMNGAIFRTNPLLTVFGYMLVVDWSVAPWQLLALSAALLSVAMVYRLNWVRIEYQHAIEMNNPALRDRALRKFGWIERILRFRLVLVLLFWLAAAGQALLYFNSLKCWFDMPANVARDAHWLYGDKLPQSPCLRDSP